MFLYYYLVAAVGFKKSLLEKEQPLDIIYERLFIGPDIWCLGPDKTSNGNIYWKSLPANRRLVHKIFSIPRTTSR